MTWDWKIGGLLLGVVFFAAVLLVKPIGVSTQFVILNGLLTDAVSPDFITQTEDGYTSTNAYMAKSGGKYAANAANPLNYSFVFVLAMASGAFLSTLLKGRIGARTVAAEQDCVPAVRALVRTVAPRESIGAPVALEE